MPFTPLPKPTKPKVTGSINLPAPYGYHRVPGKGGGRLVPNPAPPPAPTADFTKGLGKATERSLPKPPAVPTNRGSSGGGGLGGGGVAAVEAPVAPEAPAQYGAGDLIAKLKMFDADPQALRDIYGAISKSILGARDTQAADVEAQRAATRKIYDDSTAMVAQKLAEDKARLGAAGEGLGVNLNASVLSKNWDENSLNQQISQEAYRGADEIYWNKAKQGGQDIFSMLNNSALLSGTNKEAALKNLVDTTNAGITTDANAKFADYELARLQAEAAAALAARSGGGGGGRRGGRGGGSGGSGGGNVYNTTAAGETSTLNNVGDEAIYNAMLEAGDTAGAAAFLRINNLSSGAPILSTTQKELDAANAAYARSAGNIMKGPVLPGLFNIGSRASAANKSLTNKQTLERVLAAVMPLGGIMGNPKTTATVSNKASQRTYIPNTPYKTTASAPKPVAKPPSLGGIFKKK